jgi:hypothetical protein
MHEPTLVRCRRPPILTTIVAIAAFSLLASGCGGGSSGSTAAATRTTQNGALAFARCMRSHGVQHWPDPGSNGQFDKSELRQLGVSKSEINAAQSACQHLFPFSSGPTRAQQQARDRAALAFAACMRARGFANFPDPTAQGQLTPQMVAAAGIDLHQPGLLRVGIACTGVTHGWLKPAAVERAVNGG